MYVDGNSLSSGAVPWRDTEWDPRAGLTSPNHKIWKPLNICTATWVMDTKCILVCILSIAKQNKFMSISIKPPGRMILHFQ